MTVKKLSTTVPAAGAPFFTPAQDPPAGTALDTDAELPTLFTPLKLRGLTLQNRFAVSPMCMYSADDGHLTDFHLVHLGAFATRGAALTIVEASAVTPNGRLCPEDSGIWADSHIAPLKRIADFIHSQNQKVGIQLGHAGRKASAVPPWVKTNHGNDIATAEQGGWPDNLWAPSAIPYDEGHPTPKEMTVADIDSVVQSFADAAERAVKADMDTIEIHGAHGYLINEFLSPITNKRTDAYGGSFENRTRLLFAIIAAIRAVIPSTMPLFLRLSASEWMEWDHASQPSWDLSETQRLAVLLPDLGVDLLDVSSGGNNPKQAIKIHPLYQVDMAEAIRAEVRKQGKELLIGAVGMIADAEFARSVVQENGKVAGKQDGTVEVDAGTEGTAKADLVLVARQFLREPEFVLKTAHQLGVKVQWAHQYQRAPFRKSVML